MIKNLDKLLKKNKIEKRTDISDYLNDKRLNPRKFFSFFIAILTLFLLSYFAHSHLIKNSSNVQMISDIFSLIYVFLLVCFIRLLFSTCKKIILGFVENISIFAFQLLAFRRLERALSFEVFFLSIVITMGYFFSNDYLFSLTSEKYITEPKTIIHYIVCIFYNLSLIFSAIFAGILITKLFIEVLYLNFHRKYHATRIRLNDAVMDALEYFRREVPKKEVSTIHEFVVELFYYVNKSYDNAQLAKRDLRPIFGNRAEEIFKGLGYDKELLSIDEAVRGIENATEEKRALKNSFVQGFSAIRVTDRVLVPIISSLSCLLVLSFIENSKLVEFVKNSFQIVMGMSFIFGGVVSTCFMSFVYIFGVHPFDTNDRVIIDKEEYIIKEVGLLFTTMTKNKAVVYFPNSLLSNTRLVNLKRAVSSQEVLTINLHPDTSLEKIEELENEVKDYARINSKSFLEGACINNYNFGAEAVSVDVVLNCASNMQNLKETYERRDSFKKHLHTSIKRLGLSYAKK